MRWEHTLEARDETPDVESFDEVDFDDVPRQRGGMPARYLLPLLVASVGQIAGLAVAQFDYTFGLVVGVGCILAGLAMIPTGAR